jgi:very-short-patch-repair endonuclease
LHAGALAELLARCPTYPGAARLRRFASEEEDAPSRPTRSELEDDFLAFCERFGLPRPLVNTVVGGYEVDAYFPDLRLIVELDSWAFHKGRRAFETDRLRDVTALANAIATVRITSERLRDQPEREAARLRSIMVARRSPAA